MWYVDPNIPLYTTKLNLTTHLYQFRTVVDDISIALLNLRRRYNFSPTSPINRLNNDVLGIVFEYLRDPVKALSPEAVATPIFDSYQPLISTMLVCRRWHAVMSHKSSLWTEVDGINAPKALTYLLKNSAEAPLRLRLAMPFNEQELPEPKEFREKILSRVRRLELFFRQIRLREGLAELLGTDMPLLQGLLLRDTSTNSSSFVYTGSSASFPSLRELVLSKLLWIPSTRLLALTHLHVAETHVDVVTMLRLLTTTPALEVLELSWLRILDPQATDQPAHHVPVTLPRLSHVTLIGCKTMIVHSLLQQLDLPNIRILILKFEEIGHILPLPALVTPKISPTALRLYLSEFRDHLAVELDGGECGILLRLRRFYGFDPSQQLSLAPDPPTLPLLGQVSELHLVLNHKDGHLIVQHMPSLKRLVIVVTYAKHIVPLLRTLSEAEVVTQCLTHLKSIDIVASSLDWFPWPDLEQAVATRAGLGLRLTLLRLFNPLWSKSPGEYISQLQQYVDTVIVSNGDPPKWNRSEAFWRGERQPILGWFGNTVG